jgi:hypothetical protein
MTPSVEPVTAIHTTDTADGTRVRKSAKCNLARRKPVVEEGRKKNRRQLRTVKSSHELASKGHQKANNNRL